ncbi:hypothetical protein [Myxosarcina sp. GI1]|uniref:hypothetical protein n=1 Tax=Myxosarcina sp. GI1 TaxID=1541065 RepID=UPI00055C74B5|nr:hypothetical protein [Myxosarcina sp. GI1]
MPTIKQLETKIADHRAKIALLEERLTQVTNDVPPVPPLDLEPEKRIAALKAYHTKEADREIDLKSTQQVLEEMRSQLSVCNEDLGRERAKRAIAPIRQQAETVNQKREELMEAIEKLRKMGKDANSDYKRSFNRLLLNDLWGHEQYLPYAAALESAVYLTEIKEKRYYPNQEATNKRSL